MFGIIQSELLKMRHTFSMKLIILAPLVTLLLGYLLSGSYALLSTYNWWYFMILPLVVSLCSASMIAHYALCDKPFPVDCNNCCRHVGKYYGFSSGWTDWLYAPFPDLFVADSCYYAVSMFHGIYKNGICIFSCEHDFICCLC